MEPTPNKTPPAVEAGEAGGFSRAKVEEDFI